MIFLDLDALIHVAVRTLGEQPAVRDYALIDGNKPLALAATIAFLGINGQRLTLSNDEAYDLVMAVATGTIDDVADNAAALRSGSTGR